MIRNTFPTLYGKSLEVAVGDDLSGDEKRLFVGLMQGAKNESGQGLSLEVDLDQLYRAGEGKVGTDEANFIRLFTTRSDIALKSLFEAYEAKYGKSISQVIKSEFSGTIERMLLSLVEIIQNRPQYLAKRFENTMAGLGTNDQRLISMVVRYREPTLMSAIKREYQTLYKKSLVDRIKSETSGDYEKLLVQIVGV
jgi:hypothetical protein